MTTVCHLFDRSAGWAQRIGVAPLLDPPSSQHHAGLAVALDPAAKRAIGLTDHPITVAGPNLGESALPAVLTAPILGRLLTTHRIDIVHAWGVSAALAASVALRSRRATNRPLVIELFDPAISSMQLKTLRTIANSTHAAMACSSQSVRRSVIEGGIAPERCVVIRPGVDFARIGQAKKSRLRRRLGCPPPTTLIALPPSTRMSDELLHAFWGCALLNQLGDDVRIVVPAPGLRLERLIRFAAALPGTSALIVPPFDYHYEDLLSVADVLVLPAWDRLDITSVAWAMASGALVIGPAVRSVAELIANKHNGLLFKKEPGANMGVTIAGRLRDRSSHEKVREVARGQAYEVFGRQRCIEQHRRLYGNLQRGVDPGEGITDSAMVG